MSAAWCARLCVTAILVSVLAGCQGRETSAPEIGSAFTNWPQTLDGFRFRWSAAPGIDLLSGPAVPLRAFLESHRVGDLTSNVDDAYPGFERAVPRAGKPIDESSSDLPYELWNIQPATEPALAFNPPTRFYGNEYFHVLELNPVDGGYRAIVCDGLYGIFHDSEEPNRYVPVYDSTQTAPNPDDNAVKVWRVDLTDAPPTEGAPGSVTTPQRGPNPAPLDDVFGPWRITGASPNTSWGARNDAAAGPLPNYLQLKQQCRDQMPHNAAQREAIYSSKLDSPPTPEPAAPGWPGSTT